MSYQKSLELHLAAYKRDTLGVPEAGNFDFRGRIVSRHHILPLEHADLNLLPEARSLDPTRDGKIKRHKYFHHLNSSQAFTFNLFLPYFSGGSEAQTALLAALGQKGRLESWQLEAIPVEAEGTNIDALWTTTDGLTTICEVKLSEAEFGKAVLDDRHRTKLAQTYRPLLSNFVDARMLEEQTFCASYQIFRNIWHLAQLEHGRLLFLMPRANKKLWEELDAALVGVGQPLQARIAAVAIEDVLVHLTRAESLPALLSAHAQAMVDKYLISPRTTF